MCPPELLGKFKNNREGATWMYRRIAQVTLLSAVVTGVAVGQNLIEGIGPGPQQNNTRIRPQALKSADPKVVVFIGDRVIPHFVDGGSWQTAMTVINLENHSTT